MNKTQTRDGKGQIDDVLFSMIAEQMSNQVPAEQAEQISIEDSVHPASMKMYDAARSAIKSPAILEKYNPSLSPEELSSLTIIDNYCTMFGIVGKEKVVKIIEKKLENDEPLDNILKFAALEFGEKLSKKDKKKVIEGFMSTVKPVIMDYLKRTGIAQEDLKAKVPGLENMVNTYNAVQDKEKEALEARLQSDKLYAAAKITQLVLKKAGKDFAEKSAYYPTFLFGGMLPGKFRDKLYDRLFLTRKQKNLGYGLSFLGEFLLSGSATAITATQLHAHGYDTTASIVIGSVLSLFGPFIRFLNDSRECYDKRNKGSVLTTVPYYVGKGLYAAGKAVFYKAPKNTISYFTESIDSAKQETYRQLLGKDQIQKTDDKDSGAGKNAAPM